MNHLTATDVAQTLRLQRRDSDLLKSPRNFEALWKLGGEHASRKEEIWPPMNADERRF
jgi:hypothetical protein